MRFRSRTVGRLAVRAASAEPHSVDRAFTIEDQAAVGIGSVRAALKAVQHFLREMEVRIYLDALKANIELLEERLEDDEQPSA
jgi:hypothetical protein